MSANHPDFPPPGDSDLPSLPTGHKPAGSAPRSIVKVPIVQPESLKAREVAEAVLTWLFANTDHWVEKKIATVATISDAYAKQLAQLVALEKIGDVEGSGSTAQEMAGYVPPQS